MKRLLKYLVLFELCYLVVANGALYLPLTQDIVNSIRPEKFHVAWQRAWTWYPFRVHVVGASGNGQSRNQQWQFSADRASASISLAPLVFKRVWLRGVSAENVNYRQRPRLKPDKDYSGTLDYFPPIEGREIIPAETGPRKSKRPWHVSIRDISVEGVHQLWIYQARGEVHGSAAGKLAVESRGGEFSLAVRQLELGLRQLRLGDAYPVFERGKLSGSLAFEPFVRRDNRGLQMLQHLSADLQVDIEPVTLAFLNLFTLNMKGVRVNGEGAVQGLLRYQHGQVLPGTDFTVAAKQMQVSVMDHDIQGHGLVGLRLGPETDDQLDLNFRFDEVAIKHRDESSPLLVGSGLVLSLGADGRVLPQDDQLNRGVSIGVQLENVAVPDLHVLQRYLPGKWPLELKGGDGRLSGEAWLAATALNVDLQLVSSNATAALRDYVFDTNIDASLKLDNPSLAEQPTRVGGSFIRLEGARLQRAGREAAPRWEAYLTVLEGEFGLLASEREKSGVAMDLLDVLADTEARQLLGESQGEFHFEAGINDLGWLGLFVGDVPKATFTGEGALEGVLLLEAGLPAPGTKIEVLSQELGFQFLDFMAQGDGGVTLQVKEGGAAPDWEFAVQLQQGRMRRQGDDFDTVTGAELAAFALAENVTLQGGATDVELQLQINSAQVEEMTVFNSYFPKQTPLRFIDGSAELAADIRLWRDDAKGWLKLDAREVQASLDEQQLQGDLRADIRVLGGVPREMRFDIGGSSVRLDQVHVLGENRKFDSESWAAVVDLERGKARWRAPLELDAELALRISDSRPFVAVFENGGWRPGFLTKALTVEDIEGHATLKLFDNTLLIPSAEIGSDLIEAGARGVFGDSRRQGVFYFRYRRADALLKIDGEDRNLDVLKAEEKYQGYTAGGPLP